MVVLIQPLQRQKSKAMCKWNDIVWLVLIGIDYIKSDTTYLSSHEVDYQTSFSFVTCVVCVSTNFTRTDRTIGTVDERVRKDKCWYANKTELDDENKQVQKH